MDPRRVVIRPFTPGDYPAEYEIELEWEPSVCVSIDELRRQDEIQARRADRLNLKLVAETSQDSRVVGLGVLAHSIANYHPQKFWIWTGVRRAFQGQGVGSALYATLEMEARTRQATALWVSVKEQEERDRAFVERRGFLPQRKVWLSSLDLLAADLEDREGRGAKLEADGIRFSTLEAEGSKDPKVRHAVYVLAQTCSRDTPRVGEFSPSTFEEFQAFQLDTTMALPAGHFLAIDHGEFVGLSTVERDQIQPDSLRIGFTGVLRAYRGRGIAAELKRRVARFARDSGFRFLKTGNDSLNGPILAINRRMGFQPEIVWITYEKMLEPRLWPEGATLLRPGASSHSPGSHG